MRTKNFFAKFLYRSNYFIVGLTFILIGSFPAAYAENNLLDELPLLETIQFELLGTDCNGTLQVTIKGHQMCQYQNGNVILTGDIQIVVFNNTIDQKEGPMHIQANKLFYNKEQRLAIITGNVLVSAPAKQLTIQTEELSYDMKEEIIFTELPIVIAHQSHELKGVGLRASKDLTHYTITAPNGTVDSNQVPVVAG